MENELNELELAIVQYNDDLDRYFTVRSNDDLENCLTYCNSDCIDCFLTWKE